MDETTEDKKGAMERCIDVMANNGLNFTSFWHGAAHGLHSISLEEIRHYFEPEAPAENRIPVVNSNLSSEQTILFNAPLRGYDKDFNTMALKVMAFFMLNDKPDFFEQGVNTLEKITHQYHMHEIYASAAPIYESMKTTPPTDPELCPCVNDVTGNGILTEMVNIAKQLKYFARQPRAASPSRWKQKYGSDKRKYNSHPISQSATSAQALIGATFIASENNRKRRDVDESEATITQLEEEYLANSTIENADKLLDVRPWRANTFLGPDQWVSYEAMLTSSMLEEEELNDFSVFMYCKINEPGLDHVKDLFD